jgi:Uma2 family endonuclease
MTIASLPTKIYTPEEYLALEVEADTRHEYRSGEIVEMPGGTPTHNEIIGNLIFLLKSALRGQPYSAFVTDQRLWIPDRKIYTYPDVMVVPRPVELQPGRKDTVINPVVIVEVLSNSTEAYDRGEKFATYRTIATVQEYLLVDQYQAHVEHYVKQGANRWLFTEFSGEDAKVALVTVPVEIALADLYEEVEFVDRLVDPAPNSEEDEKDGECLKA